MSAERWVAACAAMDPPYALVDLDAFDANAAAMVALAQGTPIRVASKSLRCRALLARALAVPGFAGVLAYSLDEAIWLAGQGVRDILVAYPTVSQAALRSWVNDPVARAQVTLMVDDPAHLQAIAAAELAGGAVSGSDSSSVSGAADGRREDLPPLRVCLDVDTALRWGALRIGARRSPLRTPDQVARAAAQITDSGIAEVVGLMFYDAQVAGVADSSPAVRLMKSASLAQLRGRRRAVVEAVTAQLGRPLEIVNGGGTGSLRALAGDAVLTELAAGSGLYSPTLFDGYRDRVTAPALHYVLSVVRKPAPDVVTCFSGGYIASGAVGADRAPTPVWPPGLALTRTEGAGEVQTPLRGPGARTLQVGDRVVFRPAKAGEPMERFEQLALVSGGELVGRVPTYRGEGRTFG